jgi:hypothetical protein
MRDTFQIDVEQCPNCSGRLKLRALVIETHNIERLGRRFVLLGTFKATLPPCTPIVRDGPVNDLYIMEVDQQQGDCKVLKQRVPVCSTPCASGSTCVDDAVCKPNPVAHSVGDVTVTGLKLTDDTSEFTVSPGAKPAYIYNPTVSFQYPPAAEGAPVKVKSAGGDYAAFELDAEGIAPVQVNGTGPIAMQSGQPLALSWAPKTAGDATLEITININHHGSTSGQILCEVADNGSLTIPASQVTRLMDLGYSGFPNVELTRRSVGAATIAPGRVELQILSSVIVDLSIAGLVSCTQNSDCLNGQTCQSTKQCG